MALRAADGQPQPDGPGRVDAVHCRLDAELFRVGAPLLIDQRVAVKAGGHELRLAGARQQIAGQLFDREAVERHVVVQGLDHPVAIGPHFALAVDRIAVRVGVARLVEPVPAPALAVVGRGEQAVDQRLVSRGTFIFDEPLDLVRRRQQSDQVEIDAANQRRSIGRGRRRQSFGFQPRQNELVDRVTDPGLVFDLGRSLACQGKQRPMAFVLGSLFNPAAQGCHVVGRQTRLLALGGRHHLVVVGRADPFDQDAFVRLAGHDGRITAQVGRGRRAIVQPQVGLAMFFVRAVAEEAVLRQDRPHVGVVAHAIRRRSRSRWHARDPRRGGQDSGNDQSAGMCRAGHPLSVGPRSGSVNKGVRTGRNRARFAPWSPLMSLILRDSASPRETCITPSYDRFFCSRGGAEEPSKSG